jgi:hypothetical protein
LKENGYRENYRAAAGSDARRLLGIEAKNKTVDRVKFLANGGDATIQLPHDWRWVNDDRPTKGPPISIDRPRLASESMCVCGLPKSIPHEHCTVDNAVEKIHDIEDARLTPVQARRLRDDRRPMIMRMLELMAIAARKTEGFVFASIEITAEKAVLNVTHRVTQSETVEV